MLLRLIPEPPVPTILFSLEFSSPSDAIPLPQFWANQFHHIVQDELEMPPNWLGLDKAAWSVALLKEVNFNLVNRVVSCMFVDGSIQEWHLTDMRLFQSLHIVLEIVRESAVASDMEQARMKALSAPPSRPITPSSGIKRHRKSRSLFQSIVSVFCPSQSTSPPLPLYDLPQEVDVVPPEPPRPSAHLRRRARAELVDIYRRHVIPALDNPFLNGGYVYWNLQSILRRYQARMHLLVQELGGELPQMRSGAATQRRISSSSASESPMDDDASTTTTESEDSVHTPRDSMVDCPILYRASASEDALINAEKGIVSPTKPLPIPRTQVQDGQSSRLNAHNHEGPMAEYAVLHASTVRLHALINRMEANERIAEADRTANLAILEVRSKRRAWSSRALHGRSELSLSGLSKPLRSSPLAYCEPITPDTIQHKGRSEKKYGMGVPRMPGGRVGASRLSITRERGICTSPNSRANSAELHVPSVGFIPFPQTDPGDDFCSTGPQDTLPLFGGPSELDGEDLDFSPPMSATSPSNSYDNLPELLASMSMSISPLMRESSVTPETDEFGALALDPPVVPYSVQRFEEPGQFSDAVEEKHQHQQDFTLAMDVKAPTVRRHLRSKARYTPPPWVSEPIPENA